jgi:hypothetical protein
VVTVRLSGLPQGQYQVELSTLPFDPANASSFDPSQPSVVGYVTNGIGSVPVDSSTAQNATEIIVAGDKGAPLAQIPVPTFGG